MSEMINSMPVDKEVRVEITHGWDGYDTIAVLGKFDWKGAADAVRDWARRHIGYKDYQDLAWSFSTMPGGHVVVDFGSHRYFARYRVEGARNEVLLPAQPGDGHGLHIFAEVEQ